MTRIARDVLVLTLALASAVPVAGAQPAASTRLQGLSLESALAELQRRGLRVIYSSEVVRPEMRVQVEPTAAQLRVVLDQLVRPHGLLARDGPNDIVLVVRNPRGRWQRAVVPPPTPGPPPRSVPTTEEVEALRFETTISVSDRDTASLTRPTPALGVQPLEVAALAGGFQNVFRAVHALPGVVATEELGSRIAVRGGSPGQNLLVLDGVEIHNPFRLVMTTDDLTTVGLASTFNADTARRIELFPGAFDLRYGDRLSSLLVIEHREGTESEAVQGLVSAGLTDANIVVEGRLPRRARGSWLVSARRGFVDLVPERVIGTTLPTSYDLHARGQWRPRDNQRLSVAGAAGRERSRLSSRVARDSGQSARARSTVAALTHDAIVGSRVTARTVLSRTDLTSALSVFELSLDNNRGANNADSIASGGPLAFDMSRDATIGDTSVRHDLGVALSQAHTLDVGAEAHRLDTTWGWRITGDRSLQQPDGSSLRLGQSLPGALASSVRSVRTGAWVQDLWQVSPHLVLQPGLRVDYSSFTGTTAWSPRLSGAWAIGSRWRLDGAVRLHTQTPGYEKTLQSDYFVDLSQARATLRPERAWHVVGGVQRRLPGDLSVRVDGYYRRFSDLVVGRLETDGERDRRLASYDVPDALWSSVGSEPLITVVPSNGGRGDARGLEVLVSRASSHASWLSGWASYTFSRARRTAYGVTRPFDYDRRHTASAVATLRLGSRVDLSATGRWATGVPRTPVRGVRLSLTPDTADADGDGNRGELVPMRDSGGDPLFQPDLGSLSDINRARQRRFARIDARLTYRPRWGGERWTFHADVLNVLNARNVALIDSVLVLAPGATRPSIVELPGDRGIPFIPSVGIRVTF